jgi:hypothetical protein
VFVCWQNKLNHAALTTSALAAIADIEENDGKPVSRQEQQDIEYALQYGAAHKKEGGQFVDLSARLSKKNNFNDDEDW